MKNKVNKSKVRSKSNALLNETSPGVDTLVNPFENIFDGKHIDFSDLINTFQELEYAKEKEEEMKKQKEKDDLLFVDELMYKANLHLRDCPIDGEGKLYDQCSKVRHKFVLDLVKRMTDIRRGVK